MRTIVFMLWICAVMMDDQRAAYALAAPDGQPGQPASVDKKITVLSVPGLSFLELAPGYSQEDKFLWESMPCLADLKKRAAWGAMNIRTPGKGLEDVYMTLGTGQFADAAPGVTGVQKGERSGNEPAVQRYERFTGDEASMDEIIVPQMEVIRRMNASNYYRARPGQLGELLASAGIQSSVWGNLDLVKTTGSLKETDIGKLHRRYAPFMVMTESGRVQNGDVSGNGLTYDRSKPFGLRTNYGWLLEKRREQQGPAVILLEIGDLQRLYEERDFYSKKSFEAIKQTILSGLDSFVGEITREMEEETKAKPNSEQELWVISPQINSDAIKEKALLAPVMMYSPSGKEGLLVSATTRRPGLLSVIDIAPTLLKAHGLGTPREMAGLPVAVEPSADAFSKLQSDLLGFQQVYKLRPPLLYSLAVYEIVVMLATLLVALFFVGKRVLGKPALLVWRTLLFSLLLAPAGLLLMGRLTMTPGWRETAVVTSGVLAFSIAVAAVAERTHKGFVFGLAGIGLTVAGLILYDGFHGAKAMQGSVLGYDPMIGARYYGIGNEFMGVLLGAALLGLTALQQALRQLRRPRRAGSEPGGSLPASGASAPTGPAARQLGAAARPAAPAGFAAWRWLPPGAAALRLLAGGAVAAAAGTAAGASAAARLRRSAAGRAAARAMAALPAAAAGAFIAGYLAAPALGTNAGGALAAAAGFGALTARLAGGRRWLRIAPVLALVLAAALAGLWLLNGGAAAGLPADKTSHIGRAFEALLQGRLDTIGAIIRRKLEMNGHLIRVSAWSKVLLTSLVVMAALVLRPRGLFRRWQRSYPYLMYGCAANVIGTIAALVLNDSGIVAAATMIVYGSVPLLLLKLESA